MLIPGPVDNPNSAQVFDRRLVEADNRMINAVRNGVYILGGELAGVAMVEIERPRPPRLDNLMAASGVTLCIAAASSAAIYTVSELRARFGT